MTYDIFLPYVKSFIALLVVMDAIGNAPIFMSLTQKTSRKETISLLNRAVGVASVLILLFIFIGKALLDFFGITVGDFQIAGGLIFLLLGLEMVLGLDFLSSRVENYDIAVVPLATPLIAGPGVLTTIVVLTSTFGIVPTLVAAVLNLLITRLVLGRSPSINRLIGKQGTELLTRVMGIILTALAISFVRSGIVSFIESAR